MPSFYKERDRSEEPLAPGDRVRPGDRLSFQVQVSVPTYVYVVNEDDEGASFLMFPLPGQSVVNPLSPGRRHRIPGISEGELLSWEVSTARAPGTFPAVREPRALARIREHREYAARCRS